MVKCHTEQWYLIEKTEICENHFNICIPFKTKISVICKNNINNLKSYIIYLAIYYISYFRLYLF